MKQKEISSDLKNRSIWFTAWIIEDLHRNHLGPHPPSQQSGIEGRRARGGPLVHERLLSPHPLPQEGSLPSAGPFSPGKTPTSLQEHPPPFPAIHSSCSRPVKGGALQKGANGLTSQVWLTREHRGRMQVPRRRRRRRTRETREATQWRAERRTWLRSPGEGQRQTCCCF